MSSLIHSVDYILNKSNYLNKSNFDVCTHRHVEEILDVLDLVS